MVNISKKFSKQQIVYRVYTDKGTQISSSWDFFFMNTDVNDARSELEIKWSLGTLDWKSLNLNVSKVVMDNKMKWKQFQTENNVQ